MGKQISKWQKKLISHNVKRQYIKLYKNCGNELEKIKDLTCDLIEEQKEEHQLHILVIICAELISAIDDKNEQQFILESIKTVLEKLD